MNQIIDLQLEYWHLFIAFLPRIILASFVLVFFYFLGGYLSKILLTFFRHILIREVHETFFRTLTKIVSIFFGIVIALNILELEKIAVSVLAGGGVTAIVLGFAFREIGENFLAGIFLAFSRPFKIGDLIRTEEFEGYVKEIELRYTHLRTEDGRDIFVPSSQLFGKPVTNFTKDGLRRISFSVGIDYANDALNACALLKATVESVHFVLKKPGPIASIIALSPQYVELQIFFWINIFEKNKDVLTIQTEVMDACRKALLAEKYILSADTTSNIAIVNNKVTTD